MPRQLIPVSRLLQALFTRARTSRGIVAAALALVLALGPLLWVATPAGAAVRAGEALAPGASPAQSSGQGDSLESAASKAGSIGRKVAMSLIGLGFAVAAIVLVFRRDFKEAAGVLVIGLICILLASPAGVDVLRGTVNTLFGS
jgi:hypothetical protein